MYTSIVLSIKMETIMRLLWNGIIPCDVYLLVVRYILIAIG